MTERYSDGGGWENVAGYSRGARTGDYIAVSGTTAHGPDGHALFPGDAYEQTRECLVRCIQAVEALGGSRESIIRTRLFLIPDVKWEGAAKAHREILGDVAPANTTLYISALVGEGFVVEVEVDAIASTKR
jgi:enamine deaminase RidA (YjgF/YER057c/UK114 family)